MSAGGAGTAGSSASSQPGLRGCYRLPAACPLAACRLPGTLIDEQSPLRFIMFKMDSLSPEAALELLTNASPSITTTTGTAPYAGFGLS